MFGDIAYQRMRVIQAVLDVDILPISLKKQGKTS